MTVYDIFLVSLTSKEKDRRYQELFVKFPWIRILEHSDAWKWTQFRDRFTETLEPPKSSHFWVIPPNQEVIDFGIFEYQPDDPNEIRIYSCYASNGEIIKNAGVCLFPSAVFQFFDPSRLEDMGYHFHSDPRVSTRHGGYQIIYPDFCPWSKTPLRDVLTSKPKLVSEYAWVIPPGQTVQPEFDLSGMIRPDSIEESPIYAYDTSSDRGLGGPILVPHRMFQPDFTDRHVVDDSIDALRAEAREYPSPTILAATSNYHYDIFVLTRTESAIRELYRPAKQIVSDRGILHAHKMAAQASMTQYFWVVDEDNLVDPDFRFDFVVNPFELRYVHLWYARNTVNDLVYGYGGIKLFPTAEILNLRYDVLYLDFTEMVATQIGLVIHSEASSTTIIDSSPFEAWKSGFREGYKLFRKSRLADGESDERLKVWRKSSNPYVVNGIETAISIARDTPEVEMYKLVNDYARMKELFDANAG